MSSYRCNRYLLQTLFFNLYNSFEMKKLIFSCFLALGLCSLTGNSIGEVPDFPKYNPKLYLDVMCPTCSFQGTFSSASTCCQNGGTCSCTCGAFTASCTSCSAPPKNETSIQKVKESNEFTLVSISEEQYANILMLAEILKSDKTSNGIKSYSYLSEMMTNLNEAKYSEYHKNANSFVTTLGYLSEKTKTKVNRLMENVGTDFRI